MYVGTENGRIYRIDLTAGQWAAPASLGRPASGFVSDILVDPTNKQYMEWDIANMLSGLSKLTNAMGGMVKMEMSDVKIDAQNLGAGETIQGYKTVHYRLVQNYNVNVKVFGRSSKSRSERRRI